MGKIISTFKYGSAKTKAILLLVIVLIAAGTVGFVIGIINFNLLILGLGSAGLVAGLILLLTAFTSVGMDSEGKDNSANSTPDSEPGKNENGRTDRSHGADSKDRRRNRQDEKKLSDGADSVNDSRTRLSSDGDIVEIEFDGYTVVPQDTKPERKRGQKNKSDSVSPEDNKKAGRADNEEDDNGGRMRHGIPVNSFADPDTAAQTAAYYTKKTYRSVLRKYKVRKNYVPIMIDSCPGFETEQTPALCWSKKDKVSFLLMEGNERVVTMPMNSFLNVTYKRNSPVVNVEGYEAMKQMEVFDTFADVMPTYESSTNRMGATSFTQNLYVLGRDLAITPRSLRSLRGKYQFKIDIFKALDVKGDYSMYFKKAYEMRILWTDNVIGQQDYQNRIRGILESMVQDSDLLRYEFEDEMNQMIQYRLITREYADFYLAQRIKKDNERRTGR